MDNRRGPSDSLTTFNDENFIGAIRGENNVGAPPLCGLRTIEMTEAAWESAKQGGAPVKMN